MKGFSELASLGLFRTHVEPPLLCDVPVDPARLRSYARRPHLGGGFGQQVVVVLFTVRLLLTGGAASARPKEN